MQDEPTPTELTKAVAGFLRDDIAPTLSGHNAFKLRVAINMLDLVIRQLTLEAGSDAAEGERLKQLLGVDGSLLDLVTRLVALEAGGDAAEAARLRQLLGTEGSLIALNRALADNIASGEMDLQTPGLVEHLWQTTMDKLAVDQPGYAAYKRELGRAKDGA